MLTVARSTRRPTVRTIVLLLGVGVVAVGCKKETANPGGACTTVADCDDSEECTVDACESGGCRYTAVDNPDSELCPPPCTSDGACDDGDACTEDACDLASGLCTNDPISGCGGDCVEDGDCDDSDACTEDTCQATGVCANNQIPDCGDGCVADAECDDLDDCTADVCDPVTHACANTEDLDLCADGPLSGAFTISVPAEGTASFFGAFSRDEAFSTSLEDEEAALAAIAIGTCAADDYGTPGEPELASLGNLAIMDGANSLAEIAPTADNQYEAYGWVLTLGDSVDVDIGGTDDVTARLLADAIDAPEGPDFHSALFDNTDLIGPEFTYSPVDADNLFLVFNYLSVDEGVTLRCRLDPAGNTFTMDPDTYEALGAWGTMRASTSNSRHFTIADANLRRQISFWTSTGTPSGSYSKAP